MTALNTYWAPLMVVLQLIIAWIIWSLSRKFVSRETYFEDIKRIDKDLTKLRQKTDVGHVCLNQNSIHQLHVSTTKLAGQIETMSALSKRIEKTLTRQEDYLLNNKGHKNE